MRAHFYSLLLSPLYFRNFCLLCIIILILDPFFHRFFQIQLVIQQNYVRYTLINIFVISIITFRTSPCPDTIPFESERKKRIKKTVSTASNYLSFLYLKSGRRPLPLYLCLVTFRYTTSQPGSISHEIPLPRPSNRRGRWKEAFSKRYISSSFSRSIVVVSSSKRDTVFSRQSESRSVCHVIFQRRREQFSTHTSLNSLYFTPLDSSSSWRKGTPHFSPIERTIGDLRPPTSKRGHVSLSDFPLS